MTRTYDDEKSIRNNYINDLDSFRQLIISRHEAHHKHKYTLTSFIAFGRWYLDKYGRIGRCNLERTVGLPAEKFGDIFETEGLGKVIRDFDFLSYSIVDINEIPGSKDKCIECGEGWTLRNAHDAVPCRIAKGSYRHKSCDAIVIDNNSREFFNTCLIKAGYKNFTMVPIKNEYHGPSPDYNVEPWWIVTTSKGNLKIGNRRSVTNIDWSDIGERDRSIRRMDEKYNTDWYADTLFKKEDSSITRGTFYIHAWSDDKVVEYLTILHKALFGNATPK